MADVPDEEFEAKLKDEKQVPSTEMFLPKKKKPRPPDAVDERAIFVWGNVREMKEKLVPFDPQEIVELPREQPLANLGPALEWLQRLHSMLESFYEKTERAARTTAADSRSDKI